LTNRTTDSGNGYLLTGGLSPHGGLSPLRRPVSSMAGYLLTGGLSPHWRPISPLAAYLLSGELSSFIKPLHKWRTGSDPHAICQDTLFYILLFYFWSRWRRTWRGSGGSGASGAMGGPTMRFLFSRPLALLTRLRRITRPVVGPCGTNNRVVTCDIEFNRLEGDPPPNAWDPLLYAWGTPTSKKSSRIFT